MKAVDNRERNYVAKHAHLAGRSGVHEKSNKAKRKNDKMKMLKATKEWS